MFQSRLNRMPPFANGLIARRRLLAGFAAGAACLMLNVMPARAQGSQSDAARQLVESAGDQLVEVINGSEAGVQRTADLQKIVDDAVDVDDVARFCLGRYIHTGSPELVAEYMKLFRRILAVNVSSKMGAYHGVTFKVTGTAPRDNGIAVATLITRPNNAPTVVQWVVSSASGQPKIVDLIAEGTSLRLTQRSDYASFLGRNHGDVGALIAGMRHQLGS
jgi:phospholipid transport system substrate-binding protein